MKPKSAVPIVSVSLAVALAATALRTTRAAGPRDRFALLREKMVRKYLEPDGITDKRVLRAFRLVPRHEFCPAPFRPYAYLDGALPIGFRQTISPPFVVAYMTQTIQPRATDKVLEIGTGSGYQAAILSPLVKEVYTIEIIPQLGRTAAARLRRLGFKNITPKIGDGYKGWKEHAPYDKIIVTCSPENVPRPLIDQLKDGGRLLIPLGERYQQVFYLFEKKDGKLTQKKLIPTLFVPMTGISEEKRQVKPDPAHPHVVNGSFETDKNGDGRPDGWHYQRQLTLATGRSPDGKHYVVLSNSDLGRRAQLMQGTGCDGRRVKRVTITAVVRYAGAKAGRQSHEMPGIMLHFFDSIRKPIGFVRLGPFLGNQRQWKRVTGTFNVPAAAREAIMQIGLNGGVGRLEVDDVKLDPASH